MSKYLIKVKNEGKREGFRLAYGCPSDGVVGESCVNIVDAVQHL
jgi:hypothetical protein